MEQRIKNEIKNQYGSIKSFSEKVDIKYTTLIDMLNGNLLKSNVENVLKVCRELGIPIEALEDSYDPLGDFSDIKYELESAGYSVVKEEDSLYGISVGKNNNYDFYNIFEFINEYYPTYRSKYIKDKGTSSGIPLIGQIAAGTPILAQQNIDSYFYIDSSIKADFCLKVQGDSMIDADILPGDIVFIRMQPTLENGEIGAIVIGEEATLKTFYTNNGQIILQPANKNYSPIVIENEDVRIAGKLVAVLNIRD